MRKTFCILGLALMSFGIWTHTALTAPVWLGIYEFSDHWILPLAVYDHGTWEKPPWPEPEAPWDVQPVDEPLLLENVPSDWVIGLSHMPNPWFVFQASSDSLVPVTIQHVKHEKTSEASVHWGLVCSRDDALKTALALTQKLPVISVRPLQVSSQSVKRLVAWLAPTWHHAAQNQIEHDMITSPEGIETGEDGSLRFFDIPVPLTQREHHPVILTRTMQFADPFVGDDIVYIEVEQHYAKSSTTDARIIYFSAWVRQHETTSSLIQATVTLWDDLSEHVLPLGVLPLDGTLYIVVQIDGYEWMGYQLQQMTDTEVQTIVTLYAGGV